MGTAEESTDIEWNKHTTFTSWQNTFNLLLPSTSEQKGSELLSSYLDTLLNLFKEQYTSIHTKSFNQLTQQEFWLDALLAIMGSSSEEPIFYHSLQMESSSERKTLDIQLTTLLQEAKTKSWKENTTSRLNQILINWLKVISQSIQKDLVKLPANQEEIDQEMQAKLRVIPMLSQTSRDFLSQLNQLIYDYQQKLNTSVSVEDISLQSLIELEKEIKKHF